MKIFDITQKQLNFTEQPHVDNAHFHEECLGLQLKTVSLLRVKSKYSNLKLNLSVYINLYTVYFSTHMSEAFLQQQTTWFSAFHVWLHVHVTSSKAKILLSTTESD